MIVSVQVPANVAIFCPPSQESGYPLSRTMQQVGWVTLLAVSVIQADIAAMRDECQKIFAYSVYVYVIGEMQKYVSHMCSDSYTMLTFICINFHQFVSTLFVILGW